MKDLSFFERFKQAWGIHARPRVNYVKSKVFPKWSNNYSFKVATKEWSALPLDDRGYISPKKILELSPKQAKELIKDFERRRYSTNGWRNYKNQWRDSLGLDNTRHKIIIDFGCGLGLESIQFARNSNQIILADINQTSLDAAEYLLNCCGFNPLEKILILEDEPLSCLKNRFDIFYSCGVLHHTPALPSIIKEARDYFKSLETGEYRLLLYSDQAWRIYSGQEINRKTPITKQKGFYRFVGRMDSVGAYADWYDDQKLSEALKDVAEITKSQYICSDKQYITFSLKPLLDE